MTEKLINDIEKVKAALDAPIPEPTHPPGARKMAKKVKTSDEGTKTKKVSKKVTKPNGTAKASHMDEDTVTLSSLASEAGIKAQSARVKLREASIARPEGRWAWPVGSKGLKEARKALGLDA